MTKEIFAQLYAEAKEVDDIGMYIDERNWQDWMSEYSDDDNNTDDIVRVLTLIYNVAKGGFKELRRIEGLSQINFCKAYKIPRTTLEQWELGICETALYTEIWIAYAVIHDQL